MARLGSVARLVDLGVQRFLLAPMVRGLIAQRLVRRICPECAEDREMTAVEAASLGARDGELVKRGAGCAACGQSGYRGRVALYEVVEGRTDLERGIADGCSEAELHRIARAQSPGLIEDGLAKIRAGLTTPQEVMRVAHERED